MRRRRITIANKRWTLVSANTREIVQLRGVHGFTTDPAARGRCIVLRGSLRGKPLLETVIHEALHASAWPIDEQTVTRYAEDVTRILWRLGFRQVENANGAE